MTIRELKASIKKAYKEQKGELFFSERALLSALFEKNGLSKEAQFFSDLNVADETSRNILLDAKCLLGGMPLQYYLGTEFFCGEEFLVSPGVLIPRPETELLVSLGEKLAKKGSLVFDFCCGSGCVGISLLKKREDLRCISFDLSPNALELTEKNRSRFSLEERLLVKKMDLLGKEAKALFEEEKPSLVLSNPPYLTGQEMKEIPKNVAQEPSMALFGGEDGLLFYRAFLSMCRETGVPFVCEMGSGQKNDVEELAKKTGIRTEFFKDQSGLWRAFLAQPILC